MTSPKAPGPPAVPDAPDSPGAPDRPAVDGMHPQPMRRRERWMIQSLLTLALLVINLVAAMITAALCTWVIPRPNGTEFNTVANAIAVPVYVGVGMIAGIAWGFRRLAARVKWSQEGRVPTEDEARDAVRLPLYLVAAHAVIWTVGAAALGLVNGILDPQLIPNVVLPTLLVGLVVCATAYLAAERILRPIAARALSHLTPDRVVIPGIAARSLMAWGLGSAIPIVGLMITAVFTLARQNATPTKLAVAILVVGGAGLLVGWLLIRIAVQAILDPVRDVRRAIARVERGDLGTSVPLYDATELGRLQTGFNRMVSGLRERERLRDLFGRHVGADVAAQALEAPTGLGGEVREAAVLFVDLVGSTELASTRPPTEVVHLLNRFFTAAVEVVDAHHGWVNKFEGDGALAVFGTPVALDDPAGAALHAARRLAERLGVDVPEVRAGIGVSVGTVVAGNVGAVERFEYTVIGDPVNEAARLTEVAKTLAGGVATSADTVTQASTEEQRHWVVGEEVTLRGRTSPTRIATPVPDDDA